MIYKELERYGASGGDKHGQFLDYFRNINNINQLEFWFDGHQEKGGSLGNVKGWFLSLMTFFGTTLSETGEAWFQAIWTNNIGLKQSLWNSADYPNGLTESNARTKFIEWVKDNNSALYKFIYVK